MIFIKVGPIEYIELAFDAYKMHEKYAWIVFKHLCSVEDSIRLLFGTKLYGLPIEIRKYRTQNKNLNFHDQLKHFQQLVSIERCNQSNNSYNSRSNDRTLNNKRDIPESLLKSSMHNNRRSDSIHKHSYMDTFNKYQHTASTNSPISIYKEERSPINRSQNSHGHHHKSERRSSSSMEFTYYEKDSYNNQHYDSKHQKHNVYTSSYKREISNNQKSERNQKNTLSFSSTSSNSSDYQGRKKNVVNQDYDNKNLNKDKLKDGLQEYDDKYRRNKNRSNDHRNFYHPYKCNYEGYERRKYKNSYDEQSSHNHKKY